MQFPLLGNMVAQGDIISIARVKIPLAPNKELEEIFSIFQALTKYRSCATKKMYIALPAQQ